MLGSETSGIVSAPFLSTNFTTTSYRITVMVNNDGTITYEQDTVLQIRGRAEPFHHIDRSRLRRVAPPSRNPAAGSA